MLQQSNPSKKDVLNQYEKQPLDKIFALLKPYRRLLVTSFFLAILFNMIGLTVPWMLKIVIDRVLPAGDYLLFSVLSVSMLIIYLTKCLLRYLFSSTIDYAGIRLIIDVR